MTPDSKPTSALGESFRRNLALQVQRDRAESDAIAKHNRLAPQAIELLIRYPVLSIRGALRMAETGRA